MMITSTGTAVPLAECPDSSAYGGSLRSAELLGKRQANPFAVMIIGLDHFENINQCFGYRIGDLLLDEIGSRVRQILEVNQEFRGSPALNLS